MANSEHNHPIAIDPFSFAQHHSRDSDPVKALDFAKSLLSSSIKYGEAIYISEAFIASVKM